MKHILWLLYAIVVIAVCYFAFFRNDSTDTSDQWELVWEEQFSHSDKIDTTVWSVIPRGTAPWNKYMSAADTCYGIGNEGLVLRGLHAEGLVNDTVPYITGGLYSKGKKAFHNGRLEIRAKLQGAKGAWPAIWLLPDPGFSETGRENCKWPYGGEIDIMERLNHDSIAYQTVHSYYTLNLKQDTIPPHFATGSINPETFNVYAVEMYPDSLCFFINDTHTFTYPRIETPLEGQFPFNQPFYLLIDMQLGGDWVGEIDPEEVPVEMIVDRVSFYQKKQ